MADDSAAPPHDLTAADWAADARDVARRALAEDGPHDITSELAGGGRATGMLIARAPTVLAGLRYAHEVARHCACGVEWHAGDGDGVEAGTAVGAIRGDLPEILRAERPLLNLLQRASGIATATRRYVEAIAHTRCRVLHTRKTAPGLRLLDVGSVLAGGGHLHRVGLDRVVMVKDNHWAALRAVGADLTGMVREARARGVDAVHVEVENEAQLEEACRARADRLLIDNQAPDAFRRLAQRARSLAPGIEIEATGGITLENVARYADAGADFVSIGALTHSPAAADLSLEIEPG